MNKEIIEYIRENRKGKVGVIIGWSTSGSPIFIGWSKCKVSKGGDKFDRKLGLEIARGRIPGCGKTVKIPHVIQKRLPDFKNRCLKYFKGAILSKVALNL